MQITCGEAATITLSNPRDFSSYVGRAKVQDPYVVFKMVDESGSEVTMYLDFAVVIEFEKALAEARRLFDEELSKKEQADGSVD